MKRIVLIYFIIAMMGFLAVGCTDSSRAPVKARVRHTKRNVYPVMRARLFTMTSQQLKLTEDRSPGQPWAVIMETGYPDATATLLAIEDGSASLYLSNGFVVIGGGEHPSVAAAAERLVEVSSEFVGDMKFTRSFPKPDAGMTTFYLRTDVGTYTVSAPEKELAYKHERLTPLFYSAQDLLTEIRKITDRVKR
jgi:hypothetical protein